MLEPQNRRPTFAKIHLDNLAHNFNIARSFIGDGISYMAVVKANAYGHGAVECARRLEKEGADWFAVATAEEGIELRENSIHQPILCFAGSWPHQANALLDNDITPVIFTLEAAKAFSAAAVDKGKQVKIHVKIDTGMGRVGMPFSNAKDLSQAIRSLPNIEVDGLMTHFSSADDPLGNEITAEQTYRFNEALKIFRAVGFDPKVTDLSNSSGAIAHPAARGSMVRLGGLLYGLTDALPSGNEVPQIRPVMSIISEVSFIKEVPAGTPIGYGRSFTTTKNSVIGTIPIGYNDGFRRSFSNKGRVIVNGKFAPVIGRVSMDWTIIDLTGIDDVRMGTTAVVIGKQGDVSVSAEDLARDADTISYEITCGISARVPRVYGPTE